MRKIKWFIISLFLLVLVPCLTLNSNVYAADVNAGTETVVRADDEEEKLAEFVDTFYATILDSQGRVVATTNPNKGVHQLYQYTSYYNPSRYVTMDDELFFYIEAKDFVMQDDKLTIKEDQYYYLDLPTYIIPNSETVVTAPENEAELLRMGAARAYGGIYEEGSTGYRLKVRFKDIANAIELNLSYQLLFNLSNTILNQTGDLKVINVDDIGGLSFFVRRPTDPVQPEEPSVYSISQTLSNANYTSSDIFDLKTTLVDSRPEAERKMLGIINVDLGSDFGFNSFNSTSTPEKSYLCAITVKVDGEELNCNSVSETEAEFTGDNIKIVALAESINSDFSDTASPRQVVLINGISFSVSATNPEEPATGIEKIEISHKEKLTTYQARTYYNSATYEDMLDNSRMIDTSIQTNKSSSTPNVTVTMGQSNYTDGYTPMKLEQQIRISQNQSNIEKVRIRFYSYNSYSFFVNHFFKADFEDETNFQILIDDQQVSFNKIAYNVNTLFTNNANETAGIETGDPQLYSQIKSYIGSQFNNYPNDYVRNMIKVSSSTNSDGERYVILLSPATYNVVKESENLGHKEYTTFDTVKGPDISYKFGEIPEMIFYILNVSNRKIDIKMNYTLGEIVRGYEIDNQIYYDIQTEVTNNYTTTYRYQTYEDEMTSFMTTKGTRLNDGIVKWDTILDTTELENFYDNNNDLTLFINTPSTLPQNELYLFNEQRVVDVTEPNPGQFGVDYVSTAYVYLGKYDPETNSCVGPFENIGQFWIAKKNIDSRVTNFKITDSNAMNALHFGQRTLAANTVNHKACLITFTKKNSFSPGDKHNEVEIELNLNGKNTFNRQIGEKVPSIRYVSNGKLPNPYPGEKSVGDVYIDESDMSVMTNWKYNERIAEPNGNSSRYTWYDYVEELPYTNPYNVILYNGMYHFYDKMEGALSNKTILDYLELHLNVQGDSKTIVFASNDFDELENKKCTQDGVCVTISYPYTQCANITDAEALDTCLMSNYGNDYMKTLKSMNNGFNVIVTGITKGVAVSVDYRTKTSLDGVPALDYIDFELDNSIARNHWETTNKYNLDSTDYELQPITATAKKRFAAGIYVEKSAEDAANGAYLSKDSAAHETIVENGISTTEYIDVNDILVDVDSHNEVDELKTLRDSLLVSGLTITLSHDERPDTIIYKDGAFIDDWANSTITFDTNSINIFSAHLQPATGVIQPNDKFTFNYELVIDMDKAVLDENPVGEGHITTYREQEQYAGGNVVITSKVEAIRPIDTQGLDPDSIESGNDYNYIDMNESKIHCFTDESVFAKYLTDDEYEKGASFSTDLTEAYYTVTYDKGSMGKTPTFKIVDELYYVNAYQGYLNTTAQANAKALNKLLLDYTNITKLKIARGDIIVYETNDALARTTEPVSINNEGANINMTYKTKEDDDTVTMLVLSGTVDKFDQTYTITYKVVTDLESFAVKAVNDELIKPDLTIYGSTYQYSPTQHNDVFGNEDEDIPRASTTSGYMSLSASKPAISKSVTYPDSYSQRYTINSNTGTTPNPITIEDFMTVQGTAGVESGLSIDNLIIRIAGNTIYENKQFVEPYGNNVTISQEGLKMTFQFKNTEDSLILGTNESIQIIYDVVVDPAKVYDENHLTNFNYYIYNYATITNQVFENSYGISSARRSHSYGMTNSKRYLGNGETTSSTRWEINSSTPNAQARDNLVITDTSTFSSQFGDYLSITDMVIKKIVGQEETVIFDYKNRINKLPDGYAITDNDGNELKFEENGVYRFKFSADRLEKGEKINIVYELSIDEEKYRNTELPLDSTLSIYNRMTVATATESYSYSSTGYASIPSRLGKKYSVYSQGSNNAILQWTITTNLDVDYDKELTEDDVVTISDELFSGLTYIDNSITVTTRKFSGSNWVTDRTLVKDQDYIFTYENNTVSVKILYPTRDKNLAIVFRTNAKSTEGLKNYVTLSVNSKNTYAHSNEVQPLFLKFVGGTVISRNVTYYIITGNKYLDNNLSSTKFKFSLVEVDAEGNAIQDGINLTAENDENGKFEFDPIRFAEVGTHYYKVSEVKENGKFNYDEKEYTIKVVVNENNNNMVVESMELLGNEDELKFNNTTLPPEKTTLTVKKVWEDEDNKAGKRPESVKFTVTGSDGNKYNVTLTGTGNEWTKDIEVLKYDANDNLVTYIVDEESIKDYVKSINDNTLTITNTYQDPNSGVINPPEPGTEGPNIPETDNEMNPQTFDGIIVYLSVFIASVIALIVVFKRFIRSNNGKQTNN